MYEFPFLISITGQSTFRSTAQSSRLERNKRYFARRRNKSPSNTLPNKKEGLYRLKSWRIHFQSNTPPIVERRTPNSKTLSNIMKKRHRAKSRVLRLTQFYFIALTESSSSLSKSQLADCTPLFSKWIRIDPSP